VRARESKKCKLLQAAEKVLSAKGVEQASIAEISQASQVPESTIYHYFKGKEDILFSVAGARVDEALRLLKEHLEGIDDPASRLRKMIWFNLRYNDMHQDYARLLLMECRYSSRFYHHKAYASIIKYARTLHKILLDGVAKGAFCNDVDTRIVRDIIFGLLDWEKASCLANREVEDTLNDFEDIVSLVMPMIVPAAEAPEANADKAARILRAATKVFSQKGYVQATISEIAKLAGVAEGTVYEYFKNKEDLLLSIPQQHYQGLIEKAPQLFLIKDPLKKLRHLIYQKFMLHLNEPDFLKVFLFQIQFNQRFFDSTVYQTFLKYIGMVTDILEQGEKEGSIRPGINPRVFRNLFLGAFSHVSLRWFLQENKAAIDRLQELKTVADLLCRAVAAK
jgi:TetR/AcrR family fatty acid metabolism transcriptional regulator